MSAKHRQPAKRNTVVIDGVVIASFLFSDDAAFFARTANEAGMFAITNPGKSAIAYFPDGSMNEPSVHKID